MIRMLALALTALLLTAPLAEAQQTRSYTPQTTFHHNLQIPRGNGNARVMNNEDSYFAQTNSRSLQRQNRANNRQMRQQRRENTIEERTASDDYATKRTGRRDRVNRNATNRALNNALQDAITNNTGLND